MATAVMLFAISKEKTHKKDPFFIFKINSRKMSGKPSCVFKSSTSMATLALSMDHSDSTSP